MTATPKELADLHAKAAKVLESNLNVTDEAGRVDPRDVMNAIKFLKDNNITTKPGSEDHLAGLLKKLPPTIEDDFAY